MFYNLKHLNDRKRFYLYDRFYLANSGCFTFRIKVAQNSMFISDFYLNFKLFSKIIKIQVFLDTFLP